MKLQKAAQSFSGFWCGLSGLGVLFLSKCCRSHPGAFLFPALSGDQSCGAAVPRTLHPAGSRPRGMGQTGRSGRAVPSSRRWPCWSLLFTLNLACSESSLASSTQSAGPSPRARGTWRFWHRFVAVQPNSTIASVRTGRSKQATGCRNF